MVSVLKDEKCCYVEPTNYEKLNSLNSVEVLPLTAKRTSHISVVSFLMDSATIGCQNQC